MRRYNFNFRVLDQFPHSSGFTHMAAAPIIFDYTAPATSRNPFPCVSAKANKQWFRSNYFWSPFLAFVTFNGVMLYQALPPEDSYAYQQFITNTTGENKSIENYLRWSSILAMTGAFEKLSHYDLPFYFMRSFVEHYLEFHYHAIFYQNLNNRVYFRGEHKKDADHLLFDLKHRIPLPYSLCNGEFSLPYVKDPTLEPDDANYITAHPNGFTKGVVSLTSCLDVTEVYGNAEAVLVVVPRSRVAPVAHHALRDEQNFQYEYVCGGIDRRDILLIAYRDLETHEINEVKLNADFSGTIDTLELDSQMQCIIDAIPDGDGIKERLQARINPALNYLDSYDRLVAPDKDTHKVGIKNRISYIANNGFNGNPFLQAFHRRFHAARWEEVQFQELQLHFPQGISLIPESSVSIHVSNKKKNASVDVQRNPTFFSESDREVVLSPKKPISFTSPIQKRTVSQLNGLAQEALARVANQKNSEVGGVVVSKRAVLGPEYENNRPALPVSEKEALENFEFVANNTDSMSPLTLPAALKKECLHIDGAVDVVSSDSSSDSDEEHDDNNKKEQSPKALRRRDRTNSSGSFVAASPEKRGRMLPSFFKTRTRGWGKSIKVPTPSSEETQSKMASL